MTFQKENQRVSASEILQAIAENRQIRLYKCTISGDLDINRLLVEDENFDTSNLNVGIEADKKTLTLSEPISFDSCTFEDNIFFAPPWDKPGRLEVVFKKDVAFNSSVFSGQTRVLQADSHSAGLRRVHFSANSCF